MSNLGTRHKTKPGPIPGDVFLLSTHHHSLLEAQEGWLPIPLCPQLCHPLSSHSGTELPTVGSKPPQVQLRRDIIMPQSSPGLHGAPDSSASAPGCPWNCNSFLHSWRGAERQQEHPAKTPLPQQRIWALQVGLECCQKSSTAQQIPVCVPWEEGCGPPT